MKTKSRNVVVFIVILTAFTFINKPTFVQDKYYSWEVYIQAHVDDWQLFVGPELYHEYMSGENIFIIYVTTPDWGLNNLNEGYNSAIKSIEWFAGNKIVTQDISFNGHLVHIININHITSFFMLLPNKDSQNNNLSSLEFGNIKTIKTVDNLTSYTWTDLIQTMKVIINTYASSNIRINAPDFEVDRQTSYIGNTPMYGYSPSVSDNSDHLAVADAVKEMMIGTNYSYRVYIDYPICRNDPRYPPNLSYEDTILKEKIFLPSYISIPIEDGIIDASKYGLQVYQHCFSREYMRMIQ